MALAVVGSAGVWGALECGLQLFTWQGLAGRCAAAGVGGDAEGWGEPREEPVPLPLFRRSPCFGPVCSRRGLTSLALCSEVFCCFQIQPSEGGSAPPVVSRCWASFFLSLHLPNADPKAPLPLASVVLVLELKQHWAQAPAPIILGSGIRSWERPGLDEFLANGKMELWATPCLAHLRGRGRPCLFLECSHRLPGYELNQKGGGPFPTSSQTLSCSFPRGACQVFFDLEQRVVRDVGREASCDIG